MSSQILLLETHLVQVAGAVIDVAMAVRAHVLEDGRQRRIHVIGDVQAERGPPARGLDCVDVVADHVRVVERAALAVAQARCR